MCRPWVCSCRRTLQASFGVLVFESGLVGWLFVFEPAHNDAAALLYLCASGLELLALITPARVQFNHGVIQPSQHLQPW